MTTTEISADSTATGVQQEQTGHRGHTDDPLYRIRRVLLRGAENTEKGYRRLLAGLAAGDPEGQVATAWTAASELRHVYSARDLVRSGAGCRASTGPAPTPT